MLKQNGIFFVEGRYYHKLCIDTGNRYQQNEQFYIEIRYMPTFNWGKKIIAKQFCFKKRTV